MSGWSDEPIKLDLSFNGVLPAIAVAGALLSVSGYLYNYLLLNEFGVSSQLYFGVGDYLASSLDAVSQVFMAAVLSLLSALLGSHDQHKKKLAHCLG